MEVDTGIESESDNEQTNQTTEMKGDPCLICGGKTKGLHFQVASCRACAAFFRRSIQAGKEYKCQRGTRDCNLTTKMKGKPLCRYCRMQKCKQLGMRLEKDLPESPPKVDHQPPLPTYDPPNAYNHGVIVPTGSLSTSCASSSTVSSPTSADSGISVSPHTRLVMRDQNRVVIDMSELEGKVTAILAQTVAQPITPGIRLTFMQQLNYGFSILYEELKPKGPVAVITEFDRYSHLRFQEKFMLNLASALMYCDYFAGLDYSDKFILYKNTWPLFDQLQRHYASIIHFGTSFDDYRLLHDEFTAVDFGNTNMRMKDMDQSQFEKMLPLWIPVRDKFVKFLMNPMKSLQLTHYEMTYLLAQILWTVQDVIGISENAQRVAEEVSEQIASELHNYYVYEMRLTNYAPRLVKLTKLIAAAKAVLNAKKDVFVIARVFDLFDCDIVGSELCDWKN